MKKILFYVTMVMASLHLRSEALECYRCTDFKTNGKEGYNLNNIPCNEDSRTAVTCLPGYDTCYKGTYNFTLEGSREEEIMISQSDCFVKMMEDVACDFMRCGMETVLRKKGIPGHNTMEDFKCDLHFCDSDLCNGGLAVKLNILSAFIFVLYYLLTF